MPPAVRDLQALIAEQSKSIAPQLGLIDESIQANDNSGQAQQQGLQAQQKQSFGDIEQAAQNKGMYFSGFSPDQQAKYTSTTYLPALAQLQAAIASTRNSLLGKKADLNKDVFDTATRLREGDVANLADYNKMIQQQQFQAAEAEKQRGFDAQQNAANRAASAAGRASQNATPDEAAIGFISNALGKDGYVSPSTFQLARKAYVAAGGDAGQFASNYWKFTGAGKGGPNEKNWKSYYYG